MVVEILVVLSLLTSVFSLWVKKKNDEQLETQWFTLYYILAFLQEQHKDFGTRVVKLKDENGEEVDLE